MKKILFILIAIMFSVPSMTGQKAIKLEKQQTKFFYAQLNLHGGFVNDINGQRWDLATQSPKNQIFIQAFGVNQKRMQKGYIKFAAINSWKLKIGFEYDNKVKDGFKYSKVNFKLGDAWVKVKTKWDGTSLVIGNKSIPYGHNPKIDPLVSFMINPIKKDIGFAQDLGLFFSTPISKNLGAEVSLTSGGVLNKPYLVCNDLVVSGDDQFDFEPDFEFGEYNYNDTWLVTGRVGTQSFKKNELGLIAVAGKIPSTQIQSDLSQIQRIGGEWVFKVNERIKMVNQAVFGLTNTSNYGDFFSTNIMNNFDFYTGKNWMFSFSHSLNLMNGDGSDDRLFNESLAGSITYVFSPHTRLRMNGFFTNIDDQLHGMAMDERQAGVFLQFVTGLGKRP